MDDLLPRQSSMKSQDNSATRFGFSRQLLDYAIGDIPKALKRQLGGVTHGTWDENFPGARDYIVRVQALAANAQDEHEVLSAVLTIASHAQHEILTGVPAFGSTTTPEQAWNNYALAQEYMIVAPLARLALAKMKVHGQRWVIEGIYDHAVGYTDEFGGAVGPIEVELIAPGKPFRFLFRSLTGEQRSSLIENFVEGGARKGSRTIEELCRAVILWGTWKPPKRGKPLKPYFSEENIDETIAEHGLSFMWQTARMVLLLSGLYRLRRDEEPKVDTSDPTVWPARWPQHVAEEYERTMRLLDEERYAYRAVAAEHRRTNQRPARVTRPDGQVILLDAVRDATGYEIDGTQRGPINKADARTDLDLLFRLIGLATRSKGEKSRTIAMEWLLENQEQKRPDLAFPGWWHWTGKPGKENSLYGYIGTSIRAEINAEFRALRYERESSGAINVENAESMPTDSTHCAVPRARGAKIHDAHEVDDSEWDDYLDDSGSKAPAYNARMEESDESLCEPDSDDPDESGEEEPDTEAFSEERVRPTKEVSPLRGIRMDLEPMFAKQVRVDRDVELAFNPTTPATNQRVPVDGELCRVVRRGTEEEQVKHGLQAWESAWSKIQRGVLIPDSKARRCTTANPGENPYPVNPEGSHSEYARRWARRWPMEADLPRPGKPHITRVRKGDGGDFPRTEGNPRTKLLRVIGTGGMSLISAFNEHSPRCLVCAAWQNPCAGCAPVINTIGGGGSGAVVHADVVGGVIAKVRLVSGGRERKEYYRDWDVYGDKDIPWIPNYTADFTAHVDRRALVHIRPLFPHPKSEVVAACPSGLTASFRDDAAMSVIALLPRAGRQDTQGTDASIRLTVARGRVTDCELLGGGSLYKVRCAFPGCPDLVYGGCCKKHRGRQINVIDAGEGTQMSESARLLRDLYVFRLFYIEGKGADHKKEFDRVDVEVALGMSRLGAVCNCRGYGHGLLLWREPYAIEKMGWNFAAAKTSLQDLGAAGKGWGGSRILEWLKDNGYSEQRPSHGEASPKGQWSAHPMYRSRWAAKSIWSLSNGVREAGWWNAILGPPESINVADIAAANFAPHELRCWPVEIVNASSDPPVPLGQMTAFKMAWRKGATPSYTWLWTTEGHETCPIVRFLVTKKLGVSEVGRAILREVTTRAYPAKYGSLLPALAALFEAVDRSRGGEMFATTREWPREEADWCAPREPERLMRHELHYFWEPRCFPVLPHCTGRPWSWPDGPEPEAPVAGPMGPIYFDARTAKGKIDSDFYPRSQTTIASAHWSNWFGPNEKSKGSVAPSRVFQENGFWVGECQSLAGGGTIRGIFTQRRGAEGFCDIRRREDKIDPRLGWFDQFWQAYCPLRSRAKRDASKSFMAVVKNEAIFKSVMEALSAQTPELLRGDEDKRPNAGSWLRRHLRQWLPNWDKLVRFGDQRLSWRFFGDLDWRLDPSGNHVGSRVFTSSIAVTLGFREAQSVGLALSKPKLIEKRYVKDRTLCTDCGGPDHGEPDNDDGQWRPDLWRSCKCQFLILNGDASRNDPDNPRDNGGRWRCFCGAYMPYILPDVPGDNHGLHKGDLVRFSKIDGALAYHSGPTLRFREDGFPQELYDARRWSLAERIRREQNRAHFFFSSMGAPIACAEWASRNGAHPGRWVPVFGYARDVHSTFDYRSTWKLVTAISEALRRAKAQDTHEQTDRIPMGCSPGSAPRTEPGPSPPSRPSYPCPYCDATTRCACRDQ